MMRDGGDGGGDGGDCCRLSILFGEREREKWECVVVVCERKCVFIVEGGF